MAGLLAEISATHKQINDLLMKSNKEALELYTEDCIVMPPDSPALKGREALFKFIEASAELMKQVEKTENIEDEVFGEGDVVTSRGKVISYGKDGNVFIETKDLIVWKKMNGKYLAHNVIWNTVKPMKA